MQISLPANFYQFNYEKIILCILLLLCFTFVVWPNCRKQLSHYTRAGKNHNEARAVYFTAKCNGAGNVEQRHDARN